MEIEIYRTEFGGDFFIFFILRREKATAKQTNKQITKSKKIEVKEKRVVE